MEINLVTISKQCSSIINISPITLPIEKPSLSNLYDEIYDIYPALDTSNFNLYWRYSDETFYQIVDYLSYLTVVMLMVDKNLYLVVDDCDEHCNENEEFLKRLDHIEFKEQLERERDIYDVKIIRKGEIREDSFEDIRKQITTDPKTDSELILYAVRKLLKIKYYTSDLIFKTKLIEATKRGWPKLKITLTPVSEEVIERVQKSTEKVKSKGSKGKNKGKDKGKKKKK